MPLLGLGTWQLTGDTCEQAVYEAIQAGYRHIDTAQAYGNEEEVGRAIVRAINDGLVTRKELFIATKVSFASHAGSMLPHLVDAQLDKLHVDYIDLYYLHSPLHSEELTADTWRALESLYSDGIVRAVGVSNFNSHELRDLLRVTDAARTDDAESESARLRPMVLQNKFDIYHQGRQLDSAGDDIAATCRDLNIRMVGYR